jgi:hypothetical protein
MLEELQLGIISWIFQQFLAISQFLKKMLEINVYSIIDSKVFGVTIGDNFLFTIGIERFYDWKHVVE